MEKEKISDPSRPSVVAKRFNDLFLHSHQLSSSAEDLEKDKFNVEKCTGFILSLVKVQYHTYKCHSRVFKYLLCRRYSR